MRVNDRHDRPEVWSGRERDPEVLVGLFWIRPPAMVVWPQQIGLAILADVRSKPGWRALCEGFGRYYSLP
jgi:hypothetical protein